MANGVNKVILIGNLGRDPEIMSLENGVKKATFSLATTETFKDKTGNKTQLTEWHNIVLWRGLAEVAESYLKKGHQIYLEGKIRTRSWEDKEGNKRYTTEILGDTMFMLGSPRGSGHEEPAASNEESAALNAAPGNGMSPAEDDLPF